MGHTKILKIKLKLSWLSFHLDFSASFQVPITMSRNIAAIFRQLIHVQSIVHALAKEAAVVYAFAKKVRPASSQI